MNALIAATAADNVAQAIKLLIHGITLKPRTVKGLKPGVMALLRQCAEQAVDKATVKQVTTALETMHKLGFTVDDKIQRRVAAMKYSSKGMDYNISDSDDSNDNTSTVDSNDSSAVAVGKDKYWADMSNDDKSAAKALGWSDVSWNEGDTAAFDTNW